MSAWLFAAMLVLAPLRGDLERYHADGERYASIADDIADEVHDAGPIAGLTERETSALVLAIMIHESGLAADVDRGERRGGGVDGCLMQIRGFRGSRTACIKRGLYLARASWGHCPTARLAAYASGSCSLGLDKSEEMLGIWRRITRRP
jgi:hypothetical protein